MKIFRKRAITRMISLALVFTILQPILAPYYSFALTHGPHQPEYTAYEEPGATDMINLLTGDFTYSLPVLEVPGPEGSFTLPLTYNAGIGLEQQSSWVGLGWNMNAGAILRNINQFPDDAAGESQMVRVMDLTGVRGWASSLLGLGNAGWNTSVGHYGSVSLFGIVSAGWGSQSSVGVFGVNVGDNGVTFNAVQFTTAVITVATWGASAAATQGGKMTAAAAVAKEAAIDLAIGAGVSAFVTSPVPSAPTAGHWKYSKKVKRRFLHKNYWITLDKTRIEDMYGVLYAGKAAPVTFSDPDDFAEVLYKNANVIEPLKVFPKTTSNGFNKGAASDINFQIDDRTEFENMHHPSFLAIDDYSVQGPGISGSIAPYRLDIGSVSMPREMTKSHHRMALVPFIDYKVPFLYGGTLSGKYFHHVGGVSSVTNPAAHFGMAAIPSNSDPSRTSSLTYELNDVIFKNERVRSDVSSILATANETNKLPQGKHVEWLSNAEIGASETYPASGFIDFLPFAKRQEFRSHAALGTTGAPTSYWGSMSSFNETIPVSSSVSSDLEAGDAAILRYTYFGENGAEYYGEINGTVSAVNTGSITLNGIYLYTPGYGTAVTFELVYYKTPQIQDGIGGYVVTAEDGTSYHYALPIYDHSEQTEIIDKNDPNKKSVVSRPYPFANTWLLTAITGSDFVDRNANGLADDGDWGYWITLNYGKHDDDYRWRLPYSNYKRDAADKVNTYSQGYKQLYYLNSIETSSHVALFLKSTRLDGRGINGSEPLKLDEISLLSKEHYKKLTTATSQGGFALPAYSGQVDNSCLSSSITPSMRDYINKNTLKRVLFTYTYDLCPGTLNSSAAGNGKLTLTRVSVRGRNDLKIVPDYIFQYGLNPSYNANYWDAWGFYNSSGTESGTTHRVTSTGAQWSLSKIITPLGSEVMINYERDSYANVSGHEPLTHRMAYSDSDFQWPYANNMFKNGQLSAAVELGILQVGSYVNLAGSATLRCNDGSELVVPYDKKHLRITKITAEYLEFDENYYVPPYPCTSVESVYFLYNAGYIEVVLPQKPGGDIRVSSIVIQDELGHQDKIRYLYSGEKGFSTGVVAQEPDYVRSPYVPTSIYDLPFYPRTPVMYGKVTVLNGKLSTDDDYHTKTVYTFETPSSNMITYALANKNADAQQQYNLVVSAGSNYEWLSLKEHVITDHSSKIGSLQSIEVFDRNDTRISSTELTYSSQLPSDNNQGIFTQGTLMCDVISYDDPFIPKRYHKLNRTTVISYPNELVSKTETVRNGFTSTTENTNWDPVTGMVVEQESTNSLGISTKTVTQPAYSKYPAMGPKAQGGKNMLASTAATYHYRTDANGAITGLMGAQVQTWRNDWDNYRMLSASSYSDAAEGLGVWRKAATYVWKGDYSRLNSNDGTQQFYVTDQFNFSPAATNSGWQKAGEIVRYDHSSMPLDARDMNNIGTAVKMGYDGRTIIASASNAYYAEIAFSGAEDKLAGQPFFGGEVGLGNGIVLRKSKGETSGTHTGDAVVSLSTGTSFIYKTEALRQQTYRAMVWANSSNARIYYKINGAEVVSAAPTESQRIGDWYLLNMEIPVTAVISSFEVGVKSAGGVVLFDDFRFQPLKAAMACYVFPPNDFEFLAGQSASAFEAILNNENLYTKYEYDARGQLIKTYQETFQFGEKLIFENRSHYRRLND